MSRRIEFVRASLVDSAPSDPAAKPGAVLEVSRLISLVIDQVKAGDPECGYFLAELFSFLSKNSDRLSSRNEMFRKCHSAWQSGRLSTKRASSLRSLIHSIVLTAQREQRIQQIANQIPHSRLVLKRDEVLLALPEFRDQSDVVTAWTDKLVYPRLRQMEAELAEHPGIGLLKKALDRHGKFRVSRLKPVIKEMVKRIAKLPPSYYFHMS